MNLAICISGHLGLKAQNEIDKYVESLKEKIIKNNVSISIFIALTYDRYADYCYYIDQLQPTNVIDMTNIDYKLPEMNISNKRPETNIENTLNMFLKVKVCDQSRLQFEKYHDLKFDCVIRMRPDLVFFKGISMVHKIKLRYSMCKVIVPFFPWQLNNLAVADYFAFGTSYGMKIYSEVFDHLLNYNEQGVIFHPETLLGFHLKSSKISFSKEKTICRLGNTVHHFNGYRIS